MKSFAFRYIWAIVPCIAACASIVVACQLGPVPKATELHGDPKELLKPPPLPAKQAAVAAPTVTAWLRSGTMAWERERFTLTALPDGRVLAVGGHGDGVVQRVDQREIIVLPGKTAELWNPSTWQWTAAANPIAHRKGHTATLLPDGRIFVAGGDRDRSVDAELQALDKDGTVIGALVSTEFYDPGTNSWQAGPDMITPRTDHLAGLLSDGRVILVGGIQPRSEAIDKNQSKSYSEPLTSAEVWDPKSNRFTKIGNLGVGDPMVAQLVVLRDDSVLVVSAGRGEVWDPKTGQWKPTGSSKVARTNFTITRLNDGKVLVTGGFSPPGSTPFQVYNSAELWDPTAGTWSITGNMNTARGLHQATLLPDGKVLIAGGDTGDIDAPNRWIASAEVYDPATGRFTPTTPLHQGHGYHAQVLLPNGDVLMAGGRVSLPRRTPDPRFPSSYLAEVWHNNAVPPANPYKIPPLPRFNPDPKSEVMAPKPGVMGSFDTTGWMAYSRDGHTVTVLVDNQVLVVGGGRRTVACDRNAQLVYRSSKETVEIWDPVTGRFHDTGDLGVMRVSHTATLLRDGRVLVIGGVDSDLSQPSPTGALATAEIWDSSSQRWMPAGSMNTPRHGHFAVLLKDGRVLVAGGAQTALSGTNELGSTEVWDPKGGAFVESAPTKGTYYQGTMVALSNGGALLVANQSAEVWDPATQAWQPTGSLKQPRILHSATLLANGDVLVIGGGQSDSVPFLTSAEVWNLKTGKWTSAGTLAQGRHSHSATLLPDGRVLVVGGFGRLKQAKSSEILASAEIWDPATSRFSPAGELLTPRENAGLALVPGGDVLVVGGTAKIVQNADGSYGEAAASSAELWKPAQRKANVRQ